jgi:hypothetical protein
MWSASDLQAKNEGWQLIRVNDFGHWAESAHVQEEGFGSGSPLALRRITQRIAHAMHGLPINLLLRLDWRKSYG